MTMRQEIGASGLCEVDVISAAPRLVRRRAEIESNTTADHILDRLVADGPMTIGVMAQSLSDRFDVEADTALRSVARIVATGQSHGLISVGSDLRTRVELSLLRRLRALTFVGVPGVAEHAMRVGWRRRHHEVSLIATVSLTMLGQAWLALGIIALVGLVAMPLAGSVPWTPDGGPVIEFAVFACVLLPVLMLAGALHEVVHLVVARVTGVAVHSVYSTGVGVGMVRDRTAPLGELAISVSGPLLAAVTAGAALTVVQQASGWPPSVLDAVFGAFVVAILYNVACLIPPSTDGARLASALKGLRKGQRA